MVVDHRPNFRPLDRANPALAPVGEALRRDVERGGNRRFAAQLPREEIESFLVRHNCKSTRYVDRVNGA